MADELIGQSVGGYDIVRPLGRGGMGEVFLARHQVLGVQRVLKFIRFDRESKNAIARFRREARVLARLDHPNIVGVVDFGEFKPGMPWLCMDYVDGPSLEDEVRTTGPLGLKATMVILRGVAEALEHAHGRHIIHRDLKPANVLLLKGDPARPRLIDFGLVRIVEDEVGGITKLTADHQLIGSPLYMSPEQAAAAEPPGPAADLYSLAAMAFTLLSGRPVFNEPTVPALVYAHAHATPEILAERCRGIVHVPDELNGLVMACLAKESTQRPTSDEVIRVLERLIAETPDDEVRESDSISHDATIQQPSRAKSSHGIPPDRPPLLFNEPPSTVDANLVEALRRQILAVCGDIARALGSSSEPALVQAQLEGFERRREDLEMELAIGVSPARQVELDREVPELGESIKDAEGRLFGAVMRVDVDGARQPNVLMLISELDDLVRRLVATLSERQA